VTVLLFATLDTKGDEAAYLRDLLRAHGVAVTLVDTGCLGEPRTAPDIGREELFRAAGTTLAALRAQNDRGAAVTAAARGAEAIARRFHERGELEGVLGIGGGAGTTIGTAAMRALPIGVPKLMVSTLASGQVAHFVGSSDVMMLNSVVDIAGLNRISRAVLARAAQAMGGMTKGRLPAVARGEKPLVAASMFGVTTACVERARAVLEQNGCEVLVFHATGSGGRTLESLAASGMLAGVLDITTTELADELVGGFLSAGPERLTAAGKAGIPQVVSVGALDMVNFHGLATVPEAFRGRRLHRHNENVTLMRTSAAECRELGRMIGAKLAGAKGEAAILFPRRGVSDLDREGMPFYDPTARTELFQGLSESHAAVPLLALDLHINDPAFAEACANELLARMRRSSSTSRPPEEP